MTRRVVITGMGWVTPLGHDVDAAWARLLRGDSAIGRISRFDASTFATDFGAEVRGFDPGAFLPPADLRAHAGAGLSTQFALAAASVAARQARLPGGKAPTPERAGVYLGAGEGPLDYDNFLYANLAGWDDAAKALDDAAWARAALARMSPVAEIEQEPNAAISHLAAHLRCEGPALNCMTACAASTQAIGEAFELIRRGDADLMIAGGAHSMIHPLGFTGFIRLTAMSTSREDPPRAAKPFDADRDGFVMGEGAGVMVLEDLDHALARGVEPLAELAGFGSSADAFRITDIQPEGRGAVAAMAQACRQAGINPRETDDRGRPRVHYVSAHGTGTQENDRIETRAVKTLFGPLAARVPFSSVKSMLGHLIQAAGAVELITCVQAIRSGFLPPTMNLNRPDPECDLDYVPNHARNENPRGGVHTCLSNSFGFGGQNNTLCVRRYVP